MNIVVDTNVFISALIKDSTTRDLIVRSKHNLLFPEFELEEIMKHKLEIIRKSGLSEREFNILLLRLLNYVRIVPIDIIIGFRSQAFDIIGEIDKDDIIFVATALAFNAVIWSNDKHFEKQRKIKIITTKGMIRKLTNRFLNYS